jgi:hypothetical protein
MLLATFAGAQAADLPSLTKAPPPPAANPFWAEVDVLAWSVKGDSLPALVTTGPPGAGALGAPGTAVLFGNSTVNDDWRPGGRITAGYWLDPRHTRGIEASFFDLGDASTDFAASSSGATLLARPFFDPTLPGQNSSLIASPGVLSGSVAINETSRLLGAGALYRQDIGNFAGERISALIGYRYLRSSDRLGISSQSTVLGGGAIPVGTAFGVTDQFEATSDFHGVDLGLTGEFARGPWSFDWRAKVALGANINSAQINGSTVVTVPGGAPVLSSGGLLALSSNIGSYSQTRFAAVPEIELKVGYQLTSQWRLIAGYDVLYWTGVQRAGGLIDTTVNSTLVPPAAAPAGPNRPQPVFNTTSLWAQGFSFGTRYEF